jgi:hypothetical protein
MIETKQMYLNYFVLYIWIYYFKVLLLLVLQESRADILAGLVVPYLC